MQLITRKGTFDFAHRILHHRRDLDKCCNIHGHTATWELTLSFEANNLSFGYMIDFGEIKRQFDGFLQKYFDHGWVSNPLDPLLKALCEDNSKIWVLSLNKDDDCNPSCENISKEIIFVASRLFASYNLQIHELKLYETVNSYVTSNMSSLSRNEYENLCVSERLQSKLNKWIHEHPIELYDEREIKKEKCNGE